MGNIYKPSKAERYGEKINSCAIREQCAQMFSSCNLLIVLCVDSFDTHVEKQTQSKCKSRRCNKACNSYVNTNMIMQIRFFEIMDLRHTNWKL